MKRKPPADARCPCGVGPSLALCCGRYLSGAAQAPDAVSLMRSRYTAYVQLDEAYLLATWHVTTRPKELDLASPGQPRWLRLEVLRSASTGAETAEVAFVARYKIGGRAQRMHELSRFVCVDGAWRYLDGDVREQADSRG